MKWMGHTARGILASGSGRSLTFIGSMKVKLRRSWDDTY